MNTDRENNHGEYWANEDGWVVSFNVKSVWKWLVSLFLLVGVANAQVSYCGVDVNKNLTPNGGVAKVTLSNLALRSEEFDNAAWTVSNSTITANATTAPDGTLTADRLVEAATTNFHRVFNTTTYSLDASTYRWSIYAKAGERTWLGLRAFYSATSYDSYFNLSNCSVGTLASGTISAVAYGVGNGWCEIIFTRTLGAPAIDGYIIPFTATGDGVGSFAGSTSNGIFIWGAQVNLASSPPDYLATTSSALTLGPLCPVGYSQSLTDPSRCFIVGPVTSRTIRTW